MSLIESAAQAPLASEEKSLDKLEIELEEKEHMIKDNDKDTHCEQSVKSESETVEKNVQNNSKKSFDFKLYQLIKSSKHSKDKAFYFTDKEASKSGDHESAKTMDEVEKDDNEKSGSKKNENATFVVQVANEDKPLDASNSNSSFLSSFSTPKWSNFRRVFSFNRSTPTTMLAAEDNVNEEMRLGEDQTGEKKPAAAIVNIPECNDKSYEEQKSENGTKVHGKEDSKKHEEAEDSFEEKANHKMDDSLHSSFSRATNTYISPIIKFFRPARISVKKQQDEDIETGESATELLDKELHANYEGEEATTEKTENNEGGEKNNAVEEPKDKECVNKSSSNQDDVNEKEGEKKKEKLVVEPSLKVKNGEEKGLKGEDAMDSKMNKSDTIWSRRQFDGMSKLQCCIFLLIFILIVLMAGLVAFAVYKAGRTIDIGSLIINGKYVNTITSCGIIQGTVENGSFAFRGIPYGREPTGELRWKHAQVHDELQHCWNGTYLAHEFRKSCWQFYRNGSYDGEEDCLYLNVFTPKVHYDTPLPVVVFIGGDSLNGGESRELEPTSSLAKERNVVFVSMSIRRSVLGFLVLELLSKNSYPMSSGNYGLSDLLTALQWVHYNIEHFGGDKTKVTLLGHQSGATLAFALMASHLAKDLVHQLWITGGSPLANIIDYQEAEKQNEIFMKEVGCEDLECLHRKTPEELLEMIPHKWRAFNQDLPTKNEKQQQWLVRDGVLLSNVERKNFSPQIPKVIGAPAEAEASVELYSFLAWNDTTQYKLYLESKLGSFHDDLPRYLTDRYFKPEFTHWQQFASLLSDVRTICPLYQTALELSRDFEAKKTYFYVSTHRRETEIGKLADGNSDIAAILGHFHIKNRKDELFVQNMQNLFFNFIETGALADNKDVENAVHLINEDIQTNGFYPNCDFWLQNNFYPNYTRVN